MALSDPDYYLTNGGVFAESVESIRETRKKHGEWEKQARLRAREYLRLAYELDSTLDATQRPEGATPTPRLGQGSMVENVERYMFQRDLKLAPSDAVVLRPEDLYKIVRDHTMRDALCAASISVAP